MEQEFLGGICGFQRDRRSLARRSFAGSSSPGVIVIALYIGLLCLFPEANALWASAESRIIQLFAPS